MSTPHVLVLANRTVDSQELHDLLLSRRQQGPLAVTLLVPAAWEVQDPHGGVESARRRINAAAHRLGDAGLDVESRVGDPDPIVALRDAWDPQRYDEVIVSTLPSRISRWLQIDLPRRAEKITGVPVTHVEASSEPQRDSAGTAS